MPTVFIPVNVVGISTELEIHMTYSISFFKNVTDTSANEQNLNKDDLIKLFTTYPDLIKSKKTAPAFVAGSFKDGKRLGDNLITRSLITLDLDYCNIDLTALEALLNASFSTFEYCAYSTASHTSECPKIRIVLFTTNETSVGDYKNVVSNLIDSFVDIKAYIDIKSSTTPSQLMFLPFKSSAEYASWSKYNSGDLVDVSLFNSYQHAMVTETTNTGELDSFESTLKSTPLDLTKEEVIAYLKQYPKKSCDYDDWLEVGECLHHQFEGNDEGKDIWLQWSLKYKKSDNNIDNIAYKWSTFSSNRQRVKTFASVINKVKSFRVENKEGGSVTMPICKTKWIHTKGKSVTPMSCEDNFKVLFDEYGIEIEYDEIFKEVIVRKNGYLFDDENVAMTCIKLLCELNGLKTSLVRETCYLFAARNKTNSWKNLILAHSPEKTNNFDRLCATVHVEPQYEDLKRVYLKTWLMQMIHMTCLNDGDRAKSARSVLVFQGKQGLGKTSWFRSLVPDEQSKYVLEGHTLNVNDFMNITTCLKHVFVELGELAATFRKSDTEQLKSFISNTTDEINKKFVAQPIKYRRRTVFFGSVNDEKFLQDQTGNSRFLVLPIIGCDHKHDIDMFDLYRELYEEAKNLDEMYYLSDEDILKQTNMNSQFETVNSLKEKFEEIYDIHVISDQKMTATKVLESLGFNITSIKKTHTNDMAKLLNDYGFTKSAKHRTWYIPKLKNSLDF